MKKDAYYIASLDGLGLIITTVQLKENEKENNYAEWEKNRTPLIGRGHGKMLAAGGRDKTKRFFCGRAAGPRKTQQQQMGGRGGVDGWANTIV
ncbi:hypothetical protein M9H77_16386 [Catharanthus roseus]|uniref:Uncharacterized protein n=1 Tax=Catharanthus roseus TaxID=4058 RepID=A0ACC0B1X0_CATRO|nr:hypothetical protein M9H77_16386 [Catharanthus roseus]